MYLIEGLSKLRHSDRAIKNNLVTENVQAQTSLQKSHRHVKNIYLPTLMFLQGYLAVTICPVSLKCFCCKTKVALWTCRGGIFGHIIILVFFNLSGSDELKHARSQHQQQRYAQPPAHSSTFDPVNTSSSKGWLHG